MAALSSATKAALCPPCPPIVNLVQPVFVLALFERLQKVSQASRFLVNHIDRKARGFHRTTAFVTHHDKALDIQMQRSVPVPPGHR